MQLCFYLTFNGSCREAMIFYRKCLGGSLFVQTIGESPLAERLPPLMKKAVLQATLICEGFTLVGTDMVGEQGLVKGNTMALMLQCTSEEETHRYYNALSSGGIKTQPPIYNYWGALFGDLTDRYGNQWLLHCPSEDKAMAIHL